MPTWACLLGFCAWTRLQLLKNPIIRVSLPRVGRGIVGDGWVSHVVPCFRYKAGQFSSSSSLALPCSRFAFLFLFLRLSAMVKSEPMDIAPEETAAAPPAKRPRGRPPKTGAVGGQIGRAHV